MNAPDSDEPAGIAELRAARRALDAAAERLARSNDELAERRRVVDDLESLVDLLLDETECAVVVVDADRRVTALSRVAAEASGLAPGDPLGDALGDGVARRVGELLDDPAAGDHDLGTDGRGARVQILPGGGAVLRMSMAGVYDAPRSGSTRSDSGR